ncbi:MAG TPA: HEAT repeat domain-containing protein, partial [Phycisphaerae bacterium]|nr:HEAT repeat domain-containing protein [Phycisphaerae bacterium]
TASGPGLRRWLVRTDDENFRGVAAEALGAMGEKESIPALEAALNVEPFPWVRERITQALSKLR